MAAVSSSTYIPAFSVVTRDMGHGTAYPLSLPNVGILADGNNPQT